ncbi:hypothetical protein THAOC_08978 [Thalassiosira oceanica]|uniref:Uncharacterized protein n=1 Tax=Thalassiosira oceanica TaxID=159749 RepID=K0SXR2_THAOC|nr:hypothetical protein THAOC_08978 [Thalassiosira oceanica]|eukprot:EJK69734.1 hypothetical protein THAOC_08978 [Thalassiosira oceanica]
MLGRLEFKIHNSAEKKRLARSLTKIRGDSRESFAVTSVAAAYGHAQLMILAQRGVSWAQAVVGTRMAMGINGFEKREQAALEWLCKAAAQNYPPALSELSDLHRVGFKSLVRKSQEKANELLLKSANLGFALANSRLALCYIQGACGFEKNPDMAYFRASVAFALDSKDERAALILGSFSL